MRVGIFGAGAVGGYLGVRLSAAGAEVALLGRAALLAQRSALEACDRRGRCLRPAATLRIGETPEVLAGSQVCLVTVKSGGTATAGAALADCLPRDCLVVSFQNGLHNVSLLQTALPRHTVLAGMITFNVIRVGARLQKATSGPLLCERSKHPQLAPLRRALAAVGEPLGTRRDMQAIQAGKLLLNLNNGLCAATGLPIARSLASAQLRWCFSRCIAEGLRVMRGAGLRPAAIGLLGPAAIARLLTVPDLLFRLLSQTVMRIDPQARSSTLQDLERGKPTEIAALNGEIVSLAEGHGLRAPANEHVVACVRVLERQPPGALEFFSPAALRDGIARAIGVL